MVPVSCVKAHTVLRWVSEQLLRDENGAGSNVSSVETQQTWGLCLSIHYSWRLLKGNLASPLVLAASWKWWKCL